MHFQAPLSITGISCCQNIHWHGVMHAGRHVLTELVKDPFVPNDTHMELHTGRIQVRPQSVCLTLIFFGTQGMACAGRA